MGLFGTTFIDLEVGERLAGLLERWLGRQGDNRQIIRRLNLIMSKQEDFDAQIQAANEKLDGIGSAVAAEAAQVAEFIAANPAVDTSGLAGVVERLGGVGASVSGIFEPAAEPAPEPAPSDEPVVEG